MNDHKINQFFYIIFYTYITFKSSKQTFLSVKQSEDVTKCTEML